MKWFFFSQFQTLWLTSFRWLALLLLPAAKKPEMLSFFADNKQKSSEEEKDENHVKNICFLCIGKRSLYFDGFIGLRNTHVGDDAK